VNEVYKCFSVRVLRRCGGCEGVGFGGGGWSVGDGFGVLWRGWGVL